MHHPRRFSMLANEFHSTRSNLVLDDLPNVGVLQ